MATYVKDTGQARRWQTVNATSADVVFTEAPKYIYSGTAATLMLEGDDGNASPFEVAAGQMLFVSPAKIRTTGTSGTTATSLKALF